MFAHPEYLVETDWLEKHLEDRDLRIIDCTVFVKAGPPSADGKSLPMVRESGRAAYEQGHIPGAIFADLIEELSAQAPLPYTMPSAARFADAMARHGVGEGTRVVCYDAAMNMWATRLWWMLRAFGFDNAAVLDGGWRKWTKEGRPISRDKPAHGPATFIARPRPELVSVKQDVVNALGGSTCLLNALPAPMHTGQAPVPFSRPGHIPSSINVPAVALVDQETHAFLPEAELRRRLQAALSGGPVITYCASGIAATSDAFVLAMLGVESVSVYAGSMTEWARDESLPVELG